MADAAPNPEWYLARDGQQYGPLTDLEMRKFVELGHLRPTDLVWRQGFPDWRAAPTVFHTPAAVPPPSGPRASAPAPEFPDWPVQATAPEAATRGHAGVSPAATAGRERRHLAVSAPYGGPGTEPHGVDDEEERVTPRPSRGVLRWIILALSLAAAAGGAGWLAINHPNVVPWLSPTHQAPEEPAASEAPLESLRSTPFKGVGDDPEALDRSFQKAALWQLAKREFPEWYAERLNEVVRLREARRDEAAITQQLALAIVGLRRRHADAALAAPAKRVHAIAAGFLDNLRHLSAHSAGACYGFISQGETSPHVLGLMDEPVHVEPLQRLMTAVLTAAAEGRRSPHVHLPPRAADYEALKQRLKSGGWSEKDLQLFSDRRALAGATPETVCRMVQDWFAAQLGIADRDVQTRLLVESLKPVVAD